MTAPASKGLRVVKDTPALSVKGLKVEYRTDLGWRRIARDLDLEVGRGETLGIVGESGSGKSVTAQALAGLAHPRGARVSWDSFQIGDHHVSGTTEREWRTLRGRRVGMIFQHPSQALDPAFHVGDQIAEVVRRHEKVSRSQARARAIELMDRVGIADPAERYSQYPHTFSGGMCQRIGIAIALAASPDVLIADEPTTALDVTVQAKILDLLRELKADLGLSIIMISHDLAVVGEIASRVVVMYAGQIIESATAADAFDAPLHPYTNGLLAAQPRLGHPLVGIPGLPPADFEADAGCAFGPRCTHFDARTCSSPVELVTNRPGRAVRCVQVS